MSAAPTPGPFTVHVHMGGVEVRDARGLEVAWFGKQHRMRPDRIDEIEIDEAEANARLFVASRSSESGRREGK